MIAPLLALFLFDAGTTARQHLSFAVSGTPVVRAETANGSISVTTGANRVEVVAVKEASSASELGAIVVSSSNSGGTISLKATLPKNCDCSVSFEVTVPPGTALDLSSNNGSVSAQGISGNASLRTANGSLRAVYAAASPVNSIQMSTLNGSVSLSLPSSARLGRVRASTMAGSISNGWGLDQSRGMAGAGIDRTVSAGGIAVTLKTLNGSISFTKS